MVLEVSTSNGHAASYGETSSCFEQAATRFNANSRMAVNVNCKIVRDRYKRNQEQLDKVENGNQNMSRVGGEVGEINELIMKIRQKRDDITAEKTAEQDFHGEIDA